MAKLTTQIARGLVNKIEDYQARIAAIYAEARTYDGINNDNVIRDILAARKTEQDAREEASSLLGSFDIDEADL